MAFTPSVDSDGSEKRRVKSLAPLSRELALPPWLLAGKPDNGERPGSARKEILVWGAGDTLDVYDRESGIAVEPNGLFGVVACWKAVKIVEEIAVKAAEGFAAYRRVTSSLKAMSF